MKDLRFDWDDGNWPKCGKHGLTKAQIEEALQNDPAIAPDPSQTETRWRAIGTLSSSRMVFVVFTFREVETELLIRPISARYMHDKEVKNYERR